MAWNAHGVLFHHTKLAAFATEYDLDIILLSETFLTSAVSFQLPASTMYLMDNPAQNNTAHPSGGIAVLVHRHVAQLPIVNFPSGESSPGNSGGPLYQALRGLSHLSIPFTWVRQASTARGVGHPP